MTAGLIDAPRQKHLVFWYVLFLCWLTQAWFYQKCQDKKTRSLKIFVKKDLFIVSDLFQHLNLHNYLRIKQTKIDIFGVEAGRGQQSEVCDRTAVTRGKNFWFEFKPNFKPFFLGKLITMWKFKILGGLEVLPLDHLFLT